MLFVAFLPVTPRQATLAGDASDAASRVAAAAHADQATTHAIPRLPRSVRARFLHTPGGATPAPLNEDLNCAAPAARRGQKGLRPAKRTCCGT